MLTTGRYPTLSDPNYKIPSDWRLQLAADYGFEIPYVGEEFTWTTEYLYVDKQDNSTWKDVSLRDSENSRYYTGWSA